MPAVGQLRLGLVDPNDLVKAKLAVENPKLATIATSFDEFCDCDRGYQAVSERNPSEERPCLGRSSQEIIENGRLDDHRALRTGAPRSVIRRRSPSTNATGSAASGRDAQSPKAGCRRDLDPGACRGAGLAGRCSTITSASPGSLSEGTASVTRLLGGTRTIKRVATRFSPPCRRARATETARSPFIHISPAASTSSRRLMRRGLRGRVPPSTHKDTATALTGVGPPRRLLTRRLTRHRTVRTWTGELRQPCRPAKTAAKARKRPPSDGPRMELRQPDPVRPGMPSSVP